MLNHYEVKGLDKREGTQVDRARVKQELEALDFQVIIEDDLKLKEIHEVLLKVAKKDHTKNDCLVVLVMTHGEKNKLYARDKTYAVETIWEAFTPEKCPTLVGKPKLFFIQACRGKKFDMGIQLGSRAMFLDSVDSHSHDEPGYKIPTMADFLMMYSTFDDHFSWRNPVNGSWFIQSLCNELQENGKTNDLLTILTGVSRRVAFDYQSNVPNNLKMDEMKQVPMMVSMLTKIFFFTPKGTNV